MSEARRFAIVAEGVVCNVVVAAHEAMLGFADARTRAVDLESHTETPSAGWRFDGVAFTPPPPFADDESQTKARAVALVNTAAGACRARYVTVAPGQAETYILKAEELRAYDAALAQGPVDPTDYPILYAESQATGASFASTVTLVRTMRAAWIALAAAVEGIRRGAIVAIERATTDAMILEAIPDTWP